MKTWNLESTRATVLLHLGLFAMVSAVVLFSERSAPPAAPPPMDMRVVAMRTAGSTDMPMASPRSLQPVLGIGGTASLAGGCTRGSDLAEHAFRGAAECGREVGASAALRKPSKQPATGRNDR